MFSETLAGSRDLLESGKPLLIEVEAQTQDEGVRLIALRFEALDDAVLRAAPGLKIFLRKPDPLPSLRSLLDREAGGRGEIVLLLDLPEQEIEMKLTNGYAISAAVRAAIKAIPEVVEIQDI